MEKFNTLQYDFKFYVNTIIMRALFEGDKYGYEICKVVESRTNGWYKIKQPTLYSCLNRLEAQGLIRSYANDESATHGGKRRYYSLTQQGIEDFTKSQDEWEYSRTIIDRLISDKEVDLSRLPPPIEPFKRKARKKPVPGAVTITKTVIVNTEASAVTDTAAEAKTEEAASLTLTLPKDDIENLMSSYAGDSYSDSVRAQEYVESPVFTTVTQPEYNEFEEFDGDDAVSGVRTASSE
ncbi:hypothetical protein FACS1894211_09800 [Clostridia bacterium]|nr:hypothetical protein FACS1894211_09800 [Clostridia bacterium]